MNTCSIQFCFIDLTTYTALRVTKKDSLVQQREQYNISTDENKKRLFEIFSLSENKYLSFFNHSQISLVGKPFSSYTNFCILSFASSFGSFICGYGNRLSVLIYHFQKFRIMPPVNHPNTSALPTSLQIAPETIASSIPS